MRLIWFQLDFTILNLIALFYCSIVVVLLISLFSRLDTKLICYIIEISVLSFQILVIIKRSCLHCCWIN